MSDATSGSEIARKDPSKRNGIVLKIALACAVLLLIGGIYYWFFLRDYVSTDDAYVGGNLATLTSQVNGVVVAFYPDEGDYVEEGQILVQVDTTDFRLEYQQAQAALDQAIMDVMKLREQVEQSRAEMRQLRAGLNKAKQDLKHRQELLPVQAVSKEEYEHTSTDVEQYTAALDAARYKWKAAVVALGPMPLEQHPLVETAKERLRQAFVTLKRCDIRSPSTGLVAKRHVQVGDWVRPGNVLMNVLALDSLWVDANYKESQLGDVRLGQPVTLTTDLHGSGVVYHGVVGRMQPGTGSAFSLLPAQNATGNWIKIVQRVPVRIYLDPQEVKKAPLVIGLSAYVTIDIHSVSGRFQPDQPTTQRAVTTCAYSVPMQEVEELIAAILRSHLNASSP